MPALLVLNSDGACESLVLTLTSFLTPPKSVVISDRNKYFFLKIEKYKKSVNVHFENVNCGSVKVRMIKIGVFIGFESHESLQRCFPGGTSSRFVGVQR